MRGRGEEKEEAEQLSGDRSVTTSQESEGRQVVWPGQRGGGEVRQVNDGAGGCAGKS